MSVCDLYSSPLNLSGAFSAVGTNPLGGNYSTSIAIDSSGKAYMGTNELDPIFRGLITTTDFSSFSNVVPTGVPGDEEIRALDIDSSDNIYVTDTKKLFKSIDDGSSFSMIYDFAASVGFMQINPFNEAMIVASMSASGVMLSTNSGTSFTPATGATTGSARRACFQNATTIYVPFSVSGGIQKSTDGGANFSPIAGAGLPSTTVFTCAVDTFNNYLYAGTGAAGLGVSTDSGATFTSHADFSSDTIYDIVINAARTIFVATNNGLYVSTNNGTNFVQKTTADGLPSNNVKMLFYHESISTLYVSTSTGLVKSTDNGATFDFPKALDDGLRSTIINAMDVDSNGNVYYGTSKGISRDL